jgi:hypothetical protein
VGAGDYSETRRHLRRWLSSDTYSFGLRRDVTIPFEAPNAKIPLIVRPMEDSDVPQLLNVQTSGLTGRGIYERLTRSEFIGAGIPTGYVACDPKNTPFYMQFLIGPKENGRLQSYFEGLFPVLGPDEALLEHAFTPESFSGLGIMSCAMAMIAEKAREFGARWVITFVLHDNIPALKGCKRAGFSPYMLRRERWRLFRRTITFEPLPDGARYPFDREAG